MGSFRIVQTSLLVVIQHTVPPHTLGYLQAPLKQPGDVQHEASATYSSGKGARAFTLPFWMYAGVFQVAMIILFWLVAEYSDDVGPEPGQTYAAYQHTHTCAALLTRSLQYLGRYS